MPIIRATAVHYRAGVIMLDVVLAGATGAVLAIVLSRPPKPDKTAKLEEQAPVAPAAAPAARKPQPSKWK